MYNNSERCCLSCGTDITHKRSDAKYCSDRCRMRYRRNKKHRELLEELIKLFRQLPNHSVQQTEHWLSLLSYNETSGNTEILYGPDLKSMTIKELTALIKKKKGQLVGEYVKQIWK